MCMVSCRPARSCSWTPTTHRTSATRRSHQFEHALFVKRRVISTGATQVVCDAGHKSHAIDSGLPRVHAFDAESELEIISTVATSTASCACGGQPPAAGAGPYVAGSGHCDPTVNLRLHDWRHRRAAQRQGGTPHQG